MSAAKTHYRVLIVGAGAGGLCMGVRLKQAGIDDFVIVDKASGVGGTWYYNTYPGAECDVQSHLYSFSFEPKADWSRPFAGQPEILAYLDHCADKYGLRPHLRFETPVSSLTWDDQQARWQIGTEAGERLSADIVVSAIGMFNNIVWPDIPGIADFTGEYFHSARWNHDVSLAGKRVGVVGIAASAIQFVPAIAPEVGELYLYQRTANWVVPKANAPYTAAEIERYRRDPQALAASREEIYETWNALCTFQQKDVLAEIERAGLERIAEVRDPETRAKLTPNHPFGCKRPLFSDLYYPVFNRDNVHLVTTDIERIGPSGVVTADGDCREVDVLIYSTGFETTTYLNAIEVSGRDGRSLADAWEDGPQAYLGITTAGFPNLFMLYGPNTNQGCILFMLERQADYALRQIERLHDEHLAWIDVRPEVMRDFNEQLQDDIRAVEVWQAACGNDFYYRAGPSGRLVTQWPKTMDDFTAVTSEDDRDAFEVGALA
ncbi:MAG: flavin-containing monooxygenase [Gammaproteobacteria bacterium]